MILKSLEIRRFRGIRDLQIGRLGRVNLIVGKNNVGKTTILEALRVYSRPGSMIELLDLLASKDEIRNSVPEALRRRLTFPVPVDGLFYGRRPGAGEEGTILIGEPEPPGHLLKISVTIIKFIVKAANADSVVLDDNMNVVGKISYTDFYVQQKFLSISFDGETRYFAVDNRILHRMIPDGAAGGSSPDHFAIDSPPMRSLPFLFIEPSGLDLKTIGRLWDEVSLTSYEQIVINALRLISPEVDRVAFREPEGGSTANGAHGRAQRDRIPFVKVANTEAPIPLRSMGDGIVRLFGIALALVRARNGLLLLDEAENGVHYSVQADLWRMIFRLAYDLNVQVFATTHSYDCIKAFEEAARGSDEEGVLIRLAQKGGRTIVAEFDEHELEVAVEGQIEVR